MKAVVAAWSVATVILAPQVSLQIDVTDPRPVSEAVSELEKRFRRVITYEDTRYVHSADIIDITDSVSRSPDRSKRIFGMRWGTIRLTVTPRSDTLDDQIAEVLDQLLAAHMKAGNAGGFRVLRSGNAFHVVPTAFTGITGQRQAYTPLLDARISLPAREESAHEGVSRLVAAVTAATGYELGVGLMPTNLFVQRRVVGGAVDEPAREALSRILEQVRPGLSWRLLCGVGENGSCALNVHIP